MGGARTARWRSGCRTAVALIGALSSLVCTKPVRAVERTFTGVVSNDWFVADNWAPTGVPGVADDAVVAGGMTVAFGTDASVASFTLAGGTLTGAGTLTVSGLMNWAGGTLAGSGAVNANGGMLISGGSVKTLSRTLNLGGAAVWADSGSLVLAAGRLNILSGGSLAIQNDQPLSFGGGSPRIDNAGTISKTSSGTTSFSNVPLISTGSILVHAGTLSLSGGGTYTGAIDATGATLQLAGGTHNFSANSSIIAATLTCTSGTANIGGAVDVRTRTQVSAGTLNLSGPIAGLAAVSVANGTLNLSSPDPVAVSLLTLAGGNLIGTSRIDVNGPVAWSGGTLGGSGALNAIHGLILSGSGTKVLGRNLNNSGDATWIDSGNLQMVSNAVLNNLVTASWLTQTDADIVSDSSSPSIINSGTFRKLGSAATRLIGVSFNNNGEVDVQGGALDLAAGGQHSGVFSFASAELDLGGAHVFLGSSIVEGANLNVTSGMLTSSGRWNVSSSTEMSGGSALLTGAVDSLGVVTIRSGSLELSPSGGVVSVPLLNLSAGALAGTGVLNVLGRLTWSGGTMGGSGVTNAGGGVWFNSAAGKTLGRTLNLGGESLWSDTGGLSLSGNARLHVLAGGSLSIQTDAALLGTDTVRVINDGIIRKDAGTLTRITAPLDNAGGLELTHGSLAALAGGQHSGRLDAGLGGLELAGGHNFGASSELTGSRITFSGDRNEVAGRYTATDETQVVGGVTTLRGSVLSTGAVVVRNATLDVSADATVSVPSLLLDFGVIDGGSDLIVAGALQWSGGSMRGTGTTFSTGGLVLGGASPKALNRRLRNSSAGRWQDTSNFSIGDGGVFENLAGAEFDIRGDGNLVFAGGSARIDNAGTWTKTAGALTAISVPAANSGLVVAASGALAFNGGYEQSAGITRLAGGDLRSVTGISIEGGRVEGSGKLAGDVANFADLSPGLSPGRIVINGDYVQQATAVYTVEIAGGSEAAFDQVYVDGDATLDGRLVVRLTDGFVPQPGARFRVLTAGHLIGNFASLEGLIVAVGQGFEPVIDADAVTLVYGDEDCGDGVDNDGDGRSDCADPKCAAYVPCTYTPTPTPTPTCTPTPTVTETPTPTETPTRIPLPACIGDCDDDSAVTIDELLRGVNIALGVAPYEACPAFDGNRNGEVEIDEIIIAVNRGLLGC